MAEETIRETMIGVKASIDTMSGEIAKLTKAVTDQNGRIDKLESFRDKVKGAGLFVGVLGVAAGILIKVL